MRQSTSTTESDLTGTQGDRTVGADRMALRLLGKFDLFIGSRPVPVGTSCQRLLTLLAVRDCPVGRARVAGTLWPDVTAARAGANLRSVLWRIQRSCAGVVEVSPYDIRLSPALAVDIHEVCRIARCLLDRSITRNPGWLSEALNCNLYEDLAPDLGDEEWLMAERERYRQLHLHALEALSEDLIAARWHGAAIETASAVTRIDPFRESARELLVRAYLAEGNQLEARRQVKEYRNLLRRELGLEPTDGFMKLIPGSGTSRSQAQHQPRKITRPPTRAM